MGLLDEAIREHLELKRRRGADAEELTRQEREALGPARRGEAAAVPAVAEPPAPALDEPATAYAAPAAPAQPPAPPERSFEEHAYEPPTAASAPAPDPRPVADDLQSTQQFSAEEVREATGRPAEPSEPDRDVVPADDPAAEGEHDELEETPDFLQETPEHDRLWFEQKPPKDFDF